MAKKTFENFITPDRYIRCDTEKELRRLYRLLTNRNFYYKDASGMRLAICAPKSVTLPIIVYVSRELMRFSLIEIKPLMDNCCNNILANAISFNWITAEIKRSDTSTKEWVRNTLPESWLHVAEEYRVKEELIRRICSTVPEIYRNQFHIKEARQFIVNRLYNVNGLLFNLIDMTDADIEKWKRISYAIKDYEESCR